MKDSTYKIKDELKTLLKKISLDGCVSFRMIGGTLYMTLYDNFRNIVRQAAWAYVGDFYHGGSRCYNFWETCRNIITNLNGTNYEWYFFLELCASSSTMEELYIKLQMMGYDV